MEYCIIMGCDNMPAEMFLLQTIENVPTKMVGKCYKSNTILSGYCNNPCHTILNRRDETYLNIAKHASNIRSVVSNSLGYNYPGYGYYYS